MNTRKGIQRAAYGLLALGLLACQAGPDGARAEEVAAAEPPVDESFVDETRVDEFADEVLREMSEYLASARSFTFRAEITYDELVHSNQMVQFGGRAEVAVQRPDRLRAEHRGDERNSRVVLDGKTATILDLNTNTYSVTDVPPGIDAAVDHVFDTYGFTVPIADFVYSDPYGAVADFIESGFWVGEHEVDGRPCHHLAFSQETLDWQIWIDAGPRPVPRKLVITYKDEPGAPQYAVRFTAWDLDAEPSEHYFEFDPPIGADEVDFLPIANDLPPRELEAQQFKNERRPA